MSTVLSLFPAQVAIGKARLPRTPDGREGPEIDIYATAIFLRTLSQVGTHIGLTSAVTNEDLELISGFDAPTPGAAGDFDAATQPQTTLDGQAAAIAGLLRSIDELRANVEQSQAVVAELRKSIEDLEIRAGYTDPFRVDWERPGAIGSLTANSGAFTTVAASGIVTGAGGLRTGIATALVTSTVAMNNGAAAAAGTIANAPVAGNPTKWIPVNDNGTTRYIPAW